MRSQIICDLENRVNRLKSRKRFYENLSLKHIPTLQAFIENFLTGIQDYYNKISIDIDDQIKELDDAINDLCGINRNVN